MKTGLEVAGHDYNGKTHQISDGSKVRMPLIGFDKFCVIVGSTGERVDKKTYKNPANARKHLCELRVA